MQIKGQLQFIADGTEFTIKEKLLDIGTGRDDVVSPKLDDYMVYKEKIKRALNPNDVSDSHGFFF